MVSLAGKSRFVADSSYFVELAREHVLVPSSERLVVAKEFERRRGSTSYFERCYGNFVEGCVPEHSIRFCRFVGDYHKALQLAGGPEIFQLHFSTCLHLSCFGFSPRFGSPSSFVYQIADTNGKAHTVVAVFDGDKVYHLAYDRGHTMLLGGNAVVVVPESVPLQSRLIS